MSQSNEATTPVLIVESVNNKRKYTKKVNEPIIQDAVITDTAVEKKPRVKKTKVTDAIDDDVDESEGPIKSRGKKTKVTDADEVSTKSNKKTKVVELVVGEISCGEVEVEVSEKPKRGKKSKKNVEVV